MKCKYCKDNYKETKGIKEAGTCEVCGKNMQKRKHGTTGHLVWQTLKEIGVGKEFSGFYIENAHAQHRLSGLRLMRKLRQDGLINYECVGARCKSRYKLISISEKYS